MENFKTLSKSDILSRLAHDGYFIDLLTLNSFIQKWGIDAIYENEFHVEFFDETAYSKILNNFFEKYNKSRYEKQAVKEELVQEGAIEYDDFQIEETEQSEPLNEPVKETKEELEAEFKNSIMPIGLSYSKPTVVTPSTNIDFRKQEDISNMCDEDSLVENSSDAHETDLLELVKTLNENGDNTEEYKPETQESQNEPLNIDAPTYNPINEIMQDKQLENMEPQVITVEIVQEEIPSAQDTQEEMPKEQVVFTEEQVEENTEMVSLRAPNPYKEQEQANFDIKEFIKDEVQKQNIINTPAPADKNAFSLDISEATLDMVAKTISGKIAQRLNNYFKTDARLSTKLELYQEKMVELKGKAKSLEEENKRLRLLLLETNRNLNSFRPSFFGLYKFERRQDVKKKK